MMDLNGVVWQQGRNDIKYQMFDFFANHVVLEGDYSLEDIRVDQELGRGNAHVYTATIGEQTLALKQIQIKNDYEYQNFLKEISFMKELSQESQWFVKYHGYLLTKMERNQYDKKKYAFIVMECAEINLEQFLTEHLHYQYRLSVQQLVNIMEQILTALASLEEINIAHCDIKPENILIMSRSSMTVKLCDVGSCKMVSNESLQEATILGTLPFLAPELVRIKNKKMASSNPFKSDVFSFGLVVLYMVTHKKFKSHERLEVQEPTYKEVIQQWMKQAKELADGESTICQILKNALEFDEFKRGKFKDLKFICFNEKKKKAILQQSMMSKLERDEQLRTQSRMQETNYFSSQPSNQLNLFRTRKHERNSFVKTVSNSGNGNSFKITRSSKSPSPVKRTISMVSSNSPQKPQYRSSQQILGQMKKVVYVSEQTKGHISLGLGQQDEKNFVLAIPQITFSKAQTITLLPSCTYDVFYQMEEVQCKRLYIESMYKELLGVPLDAPLLHFAKIRINLAHTQMVGGYEGLFRIIANQNLELLELRLTESDANFRELIFLLDRLLTESPFLQTLLICWEKRIFTEEEHILMTEKIARLPLKKLSLIMNQNYIKYEKGTRWPLPKHCEILLLDYCNNLMNNVINNLCLSLAHSTALKELHLNFQNNNLSRGDIHMILKSITGLKTLERVILNFAHNKIQELKYLETTLLQLLTIGYLQIKLHRTDVDQTRLLELIECLKELFQFSLKMFKLSCDRSMPLSTFREHIQVECIHKSSLKGKSLRCEVVGFDNSCFTVYVKKKDKAHSTRTKGGAVSKKSPKLQLLPKMSTVSQGVTLSNFNSNKQISSVCYQLYTSSESYNNYICLTCCQNNEMSKYTFYCKYCLSSCAHAALKDHYFVKVNDSTRCHCAYSGNCKSDTRPLICADIMDAPLKKEYRCLKCELSYCLVCIQSCQETHREWIVQSHNLSYFKCSRNNNT